MAKQKVMNARSEEDKKKMNNLRRKYDRGDYPYIYPHSTSDRYFCTLCRGRDKPFKDFVKHVKRPGHKKRMSLQDEEGGERRGVSECKRASEYTRGKVRPPLLGQDCYPLTVVEDHSCTNYSFSTDLKRMLGNLVCGSKSMFNFDGITDDWRKPNDINLAFQQVARQDQLYLFMMALNVRAFPDKNASKSDNVGATTENRVKHTKNYETKLRAMFPSIKLPHTIPIPTQLAVQGADKRLQERFENGQQTPLDTVLAFLSTTYNDYYAERERQNEAHEEVIKGNDARFVYVVNNPHGGPICDPDGRGVVLLVKDRIKDKGPGGSNHASFDLFALTHEASLRPVGLVRYQTYESVPGPIKESNDKIGEDKDGFLTYEGRRPAIVEITRWVESRLRPGMYTHWIWDPARETFYRGHDGDVFVNIDPNPTIAGTAEDSRIGIFVQQKIDEYATRTAPKFIV